MISHTLTLKTSPGVADAVKAFVDKKENVLCLCIGGDETITVAPDAAATLSSGTQPCYYLAYEDSPPLSVQRCFFVCPVASKVKERMVYASAKASLVADLRAMGCTFEKCTECSDESDVAHELSSQQQGGGDELAEKASAPMPPRPKRPGKGPPRLI
eukprot:PhM_4_TR10305/c0_g1_i1/m.16262